MDIFRNLDSRGNPRSRMSKLSLKTKTNSLREALRIKTANFMTSANFKSHLPTLPNYDINIYDKAVIIEASTHLQVILTNIKINFISNSFIFIIFNEKIDKQAL